MCRVTQDAGNRCSDEKPFIIFCRVQTGDYSENCREDSLPPRKVIKTWIFIWGGLISLYRLWYIMTPCNDEKNMNDQRIISRCTISRCIWMILESFVDVWVERPWQNAEKQFHFCNDPNFTCLSPPWLFFHLQQIMRRYEKQPLPTSKNVGKNESKIWKTYWKLE